MAFLQGLKTVGKPPNKGMAAVTGFLGGINQGILSAEQIKAQRIRSAVQQQEMMLRQKALEHGIEEDRQVQDWSRSLGEYQAWRAGTGDEIETQGPTQAGQALPSQPNRPAIDAKLMELARTIPDAKTRDAFLATVHEEETARALQGHQTRIAESLNDRILNNSYSKRLPGGVEDPSGAEAASALLDQVKNTKIDDPREMAQFLDYIEEQDKALRVATVAHNVKMQQRDATIANVEQQIMGREGAGVNMGEAKAVLEAFKGGLIDEQGLQRAMPDALNGTLQLKMKLMQQEAEMNDLRLQLARQSVIPGGPDGLDRTRGISMNGSGGLNLDRTRGAPSQETKPLDRAKLIQSEKTAIRESNPTMPEAEVTRRATESADQMLGNQSAGDPEEAALKKLLKSFGVNPDQEVKVNGG